MLIFKYTWNNLMKPIFFYSCFLEAPRERSLCMLKVLYIYIHISASIYKNWLKLSIVVSFIHDLCRATLAWSSCYTPIAKLNSASISINIFPFLFQFHRQKKIWIVSFKYSIVFFIASQYVTIKYKRRILFKNELIML